MFVDKVRITVIGGRGGDGAVAFHREKYVASGGPDGGDGGHGGSVILRVNDNMTTLLDFRYKRKYAAQAGANGQGKRMNGKRGEPLVIQVHHACRSYSGPRRYCRTGQHTCACSGSPAGWTYCH